MDDIDRVDEGEGGIESVEGHQTQAPFATENPPPQPPYPQPYAQQPYQQQAGYGQAL